MSPQPDAPPPPFSPRSTETAGAVSVTDLGFQTDAGTTDAFLVAPQGEPSGAGIVFFHWLEYGAPTSNRTEFLAEARDFARRGVVSLLVDGSFPWRDRPTSIEHDVAAVERDAAMLRRGLDLLVSRPGVDPTRIALVGHDFGAMYESLVFATDSTLAGMVMMAPTARWGDWFLRYWQITDAETDYRAAMAPLDPLGRLADARGRPILLQFASDDQYIPADVAAEITAAAGGSAQSVTYQAGHELDETARIDRVSWVAELLDLPRS